VRALVTGASGFIGGAVARALLRRGAHVRVLLRPGTEPNIAEPAEVEIARGDLRDAQAVSAAVRGCEAVFHVGALYSFTAPASEVLAVNVGGTRNVIEAVRAEGSRLVYTSSIATIGGMHNGVLPDEQCMPVGSPPGPYKRSKWEAEALVRQEAQRGLEAVIVNPTFPVGEGDVKPTPTGCLIRDFLEGRMPAYVDTGMNVVDVDDVAEGELLAFDRGQRGERYILGHANLTMREFLEELAIIAGRKPPRFRMPHLVALGLAHAEAFVTGRILGRAPRIPLEGVRTAREIMFASSRRAVRELGLRQTPIREVLTKAVRWFEERARREQRGVS
jgi:dihydroflavonol-4-reductase